MTTYHIARDNDSFPRIAAEYGVSPLDLKECNPQFSNGFDRGDMIKICKGKHSLALPTPVGETCTKCAFCTILTMDFRCGHDKRNVAVAYPVTSTQANCLQVIASSKKEEKIRVKITGKCGHHKRRGCPRVVLFEGDDDYYGASGLEFDILLPQQGLFNTESYEYFWKHILAPNTNPAKMIKVCGSTCTTFMMVGWIEVYPQVEWQGEITVGYDHKPHEDVNFNQRQGWKKLKVDGTWVLEGSIAITCDKTKWTLGLPKLESTAHYSKQTMTKHLFKGVQGFLDKVAPFLGDLDSKYGKIKIHWPKIRLGGGVKNEEAKDRRTVDVVGNVKLDFDPLIGVRGETDILNLLIAACPGGIGPFLVKLKQKAAEGIDNDVVTANATLEIIIAADATIKGSLEWRIATGETSWLPQKGELAAGIEFSIEGRVEVNLRVFVFKAGGGAKIGAKTGIGAALMGDRGDAGPALYGQLRFTGLTVYYSYYYEIGGSTMKKGKKIKTRKSSEWKDEYADSFPIFGPKNWPEHPQRTKLSAGGT